MNKQYEMVKEFQTKMGQPVADKPVIMELKRRLDRHGYMQEELDEFRDAETLVDQVDGLIDLAYLVNGTLVEMGVLPEKLFEIVHTANMSKLWPDGKPRTNPETGKIIKPPTFVAPEPLLQLEIDRQIADEFEINKNSRQTIEVNQLRCNGCNDVFYELEYFELDTCPNCNVSFGNVDCDMVLTLNKKIEADYKTGALKEVEDLSI